MIVTDAWTPQVNGVVTTLVNMVEQASSRGWTVDVIHPGLFKTVKLPGYPEVDLSWNLWRLGGMISPDVTSLHIATEGPLGWAARVLCALRRWRYTSGYHTNFPEYIQLKTGIPAALTYPVFRLFHSNSCAIMVPSHSTASKLREKGFKNVVVWSRGFRPDVFNPSRRRADLLDPKKINLLYVGRVSDEKNIEAFLELAAADVHLWVVGDGPARARLEKLGKATFVGYKQGIELAEHFASADVFVFPSRTDTLGIVMLEAMACGTPVAAFDVEGPCDVILQGVGGYVSDDLLDATRRAILLRRSPSVLENAAAHTWEAAADTFFRSVVSLR